MQNTKRKRNNKLKIFFIIYMTDYFLTYAGINFYQIIEERNPFLQNFFNLPIFISLLIRLFFAVIIIGSIKYLGIIRSNYCKPLLYFAITIYTIVLLMHIRWVTFILFNSSCIFLYPLQNFL